MFSPLFRREIAHIGKEFIRRITKKVYYQRSFNEETQTFIQQEISTRLSTLQILQLLLYHFSNIDKNGIIYNLSEDDIANRLHCTVKTVRNNNTLFEEYQLIALGRSSEDTIHVQLLEYPSYFLDKKQGGTGYLEMTQEFFYELFNLDNVNTLRLTLRMYLWEDSHALQRQRKKNLSSKETVMTLREIREFLPEYIKGMKAIREIAKCRTTLFEIHMEGDKVCFQLLPQFNGKRQYEVKKEIYTQHYQWLVQNYALEPITSKDIVDFVQLSIEYEFNTVSSALEEILDTELPETIQNWGGYVREWLRSRERQSA